VTARKGLELIKIPALSIMIDLYFPVSKRGRALNALISGESSLPRLGDASPTGGFAQAFPTLGLGTHFCRGGTKRFDGSAARAFERLVGSSFAVPGRQIRRPCLFSRSFGLGLVQSLWACRGGGGLQTFGFGGGTGLHWCSFGLVRLGRPFTLGAFGLSTWACRRRFVDPLSGCRGFVIRKTEASSVPAAQRFAGALLASGSKGATVPERGPRSGRGLVNQSGNATLGFGRGAGLGPPRQIRSLSSFCHNSDAVSTFLSGQVRW